MRNTLPFSSSLKEPGKYNTTVAMFSFPTGTKHVNNPSVPSQLIQGRSLTSAFTASFSVVFLKKTVGVAAFTYQSRLVLLQLDTVPCPAACYREDIIRPHSIACSVHG